MNLKVLSQILSRRFVLAATKNISTVEASLRYRGVFTPENIKLVEDIPALEVAIHGLDKSTNMTDEEFKPILAIVGDSPLKLMLAFCMLYEGRLLSVTISWKNFINVIQKLDNRRINKPELYSQIQFEYVWIMIGWMHDITKPIPSVSVIGRTIEKYRPQGEEGMKKCWRKLNEDAGYHLEQRDYHLYAKDELYTVLWAQPPREVKK